MGIYVSSGLVLTNFIRGDWCLLYIGAYQDYKKFYYKHYVSMVFSHKSFHINLVFFCCIIVRFYVNDIVQLTLVWLLVSKGKILYYTNSPLPLSIIMCSSNTSQHSKIISSILGSYMSQESTKDNQIKYPLQKITNNQSMTYDAISKYHYLFSFKIMLNKIVIIMFN